MKKRVRLALMMLAGVLVYYAAEEISMAGCVPECWDAGWGLTCCTNERCMDYCF
ncbi:MAG TPA: hypothetical protein VKM72_26645 [Thermoanaerobaculia bacterium]|nr:hypothetical protein [Thermoanaerobaculia bacterium]